VADIPKEILNNLLSSFALTDRVAVVTGGSRGLGKGLALALAAAGAHVVPVSRSRDAVSDAVSEIEALGRRSLAVSTDVTVESEVKSMVAAVTSALGRIDILVNAAGIVNIKPTIEYSLQEWEEVINVNLKGTFLCCREAGRVMLQQEKGKIINMSSVRGLQGRANDPTYPASKGAVNMLTKSLAIEWAQKGIQVNAIAPTFILTDLNKHMLDDRATREWILSRIPMGRLGNIWDLFGAAVFLASAASDFITGQILYVDGGWTAA